MFDCPDSTSHKPEKKKNIYIYIYIIYIYIAIKLDEIFSRKNLKKKQVSKYCFAIASAKHLIATVLCTSMIITINTYVNYPYVNYFYSRFANI